MSECLPQILWLWCGRGDYCRAMKSVVFEDVGVGYVGLIFFAEDDSVGLMVVVDEPMESVAMMDGSMGIRLLL